MRARGRDGGRERKGREGEGVWDPWIGGEREVEKDCKDELHLFIIIF